MASWAAEQIQQFYDVAKGDLLSPFFFSPLLPPHLSQPCSPSLPCVPALTFVSPLYELMPGLAEESSMIISTIFISFPFSHVPFASQLGKKLRCSWEFAPQDISVGQGRQTLVWAVLVFEWTGHRASSGPQQRSTVPEQCPVPVSMLTRPHGLWHGDAKPIGLGKGSWR